MVKPIPRILKLPLGWRFSSLRNTSLLTIDDKMSLLIRGVLMWSSSGILSIFFNDQKMFCYCKFATNDKTSFMSFTNINNIYNTWSCWCLLNFAEPVLSWWAKKVLQVCRVKCTLLYVWTWTKRAFYRSGQILSPERVNMKAYACVLLVTNFLER